MTQTEWIDLQRQVPKRGQRVLIRRPSGGEQEAVFTIDHLQNWPAGASWAVPTLDYNLPFYAAAEWRPLAGPARTETAGAAAQSTAAQSTAAQSAPAQRLAALPAICVEITQEAALTRLVLKALSDAVLDARPGPAAPSVRCQAAEVTALVGRMATILETSGVDAAAEAPPAPPPSCTALMQTFAQHWDRIVKAAATTDADALRASWTLRRGDTEVFDRPRGDVLRRLALSPLVHRRGQLVQSARLAGAEVQSLYAPWTLPAVTPPRPDEGA